MMRWALVMVLVVGCKRERPVDCPGAAASLVAVRDITEAKRKDAKAVVRQHCTTNKWTAAATRCIADALTATKVADCMKQHLTQAQAAGVEAALTPHLVRPPEVAKMIGFVDRMCACNDTACAQKVSDEMMRDASELARNRPALTPAQIEEVTKLGVRMSDCMNAVIVAAKPPTDADTYVATNAQYAERICACKDLACAETAAKELETWSREFIAKSTGAMQQAGQERLAAIEREIQGCVRALKSAK